MLIYTMHGTEKVIAIFFFLNMYVIIYTTQSNTNNIQIFKCQLNDCIEREIMLFKIVFLFFFITISRSITSLKLLFSK